MNYLPQSIEADKWFSDLNNRMIEFVASHPKSHLVQDSITVHRDDLEDFKISLSRG